MADEIDRLPSVRRVFVPADRISELAEFAGELRVLTKDEFENLLRRARRAENSWAAGVESARYEATLEGTRLVGTAQLEVRGIEDSISLVRWPAGPWSISEASWPDGDALVGAVGGELAFLVPPGKTRRLNLGWSAASLPSEAGFRFSFPIPSCMWGELVLDLPRGLRPRVDRGAVLGPTDAPRPERRRWVVPQSPMSVIEVVLESEEGPQPFEPTLEYERELEVDLSEEAAELVARFLVTPLHGDVDRVEFLASPGVQVFAWTGLKVQDWTEHDGKLELILGEPIAGPSQITLRALAPGPRQTYWELPQLQIAGGTWIGGNTRLRSASDLILFDVHSSHGKIVESPIGTGARSEFLIQHRSEVETVSARTSPDQSQIFARTSTSLVVGTRWEAKSAITWTVAAGEVSVLRVGIPEGWSLQRVESSPLSELSQWAVDVETGSGQVATLIFSRPLLPEVSRAVQIQLVGPELDVTTTTARLELPRFQPLGVHVTDEKVFLEAAPGWKADLEDVRQLTRITRDPAQTTMVPAPLLSLRLDGPHARGIMRIDRKPPELSAKINVAVDVQHTQIEARYQLDIESFAGIPRSIDIRLQPAGEGDLLWELPEGFTAEQLTTEANFSPAAIWRLYLPRRTGRYFRVNAEWRSKRSDEDIPLPVVPQAATVEGAVVLTSPADLTVHVDASDLMPGTPPMSSGPRRIRKTQDRQEAWLYGSSNPRLSVQVYPNSSLAPEMPWISSMRLKSQFAGHGGSVHRLWCLLQDRSGSRLLVRLPEQAKLRNLLARDIPCVQADPRTFEVTLPIGSAPRWFGFEYSTPDDSTTRWLTHELEIPQVSWPVSHFQWDLGLPSGWDVVWWSGELEAQPPSASNSWDQRWFGPLLRQPGSGLFRFWEIDAWRTWWAKQNRRDLDEAEDEVWSVLQGFVAETRPRDRTWARLLAYLDQHSRTTLVIDAKAIQEAEVGLAAMVDIHESSMKHELMGLCHESMLTLLHCERSLLVTTRGSANELAQRPDASGLRELRGDGGMRRAMEEAGWHGVDSSGRFVLASHWRPLSESTTHLGPPRAGIIDRGTVLHFGGASVPGRVSFTLVRRQDMMCTTVCAVVLTLALALLRRTRPAARWLGIMGTAVVAAFALSLVLPEVLVSPVVGLAWGLLMVVATWSRLPRPAGIPSRPVQRIMGAPAHQILILLACTALLGLWPTIPVLARGLEQNPVEPRLVFIPFDPARPAERSSASRVLVPRDLHQRMLELADRPRDFAGVVMIRTAKHTGRFHDNQLDLSSTLELVTLSPDSGGRIFLPLSGPFIRRAVLDGGPCVINSEAGGIALEVPGGGQHDLVIEMVLPIEAAETGRLSFTLPPAPESRLELVAPGDLRLVVDSPVSWEMHEEQGRQRLQADIGALGRLVCHWSRQADSPKMRVDVANLFDLRSPVARLETHAILRPESGAIRELVVEHDRRLVLEDLKAPGLIGYWRQPADPRRILLELESASSASLPLSMRFVVNDSDNAEITLPEIRFAGAQPGAKLLAFRGNGKPALEFTRPGTVVAGSVEELQALWGESLLRPGELAVFRPLPEVIEIVVRRIQPSTQSTVRIHEDLLVSATRVELESRITCDSGSGKPLRQELSLPEGYVLRNVRVSSGSQWRALDDGRLLWTRNSVGEAESSIVMEGWLPLETQLNHLPTVGVEGSYNVTGDVVVWRSRDVDVTVSDCRGLGAAELNEDEKGPFPGSTANSRWLIESPNRDARLQINPRGPRISASAAVRVSVDDDGAEWICVLDYQALEGTYQRLAWRVGPMPSGMIQIAGEGLAHREVQQDGSGQVWHVDLDEPRWTAHRSVLRSRLVPDSEGRLIVPSIAPLDVAQVEQYMLLINTTDEKLRVSGIESQPSVSPDTFGRWFSEPVTKGTLAAIELREPAETIAIEPTEPETGDDHKVLLERNRCWLVGEMILTESTLLVHSHGSGYLQAQLPPGSIIREARLNDLALRPSLDASGTCAVYLTGEEQVSEVVLLWSSNLPGSSERSSELRLSRLIKDTSPCVWEVRGSTKWQLRPTSQEAACGSEAELVQAQVLLQELEHMLELPRAGRSLERGAALSDLELSLLARIESLHRAIESDEAMPGDRSLRQGLLRARNALPQMMEKNRQVLDRAGMTPIRTRAEAQLSRVSPGSGRILLRRAEEGVVASTPLTASWELGLSGTPVYFVSNRDGLLLRLSSGGWFVLEDFSRICLTTLAFGVLCLWVIRAGGSRGWPAILLAIAGAIWCWKLQPEPFGPLLLVAAAGLYLYRTTSPITPSLLRPTNTPG